MKILFFTNEPFPCNRPIVTQLWNRNLSAQGNSILFVMRGAVRFAEKKQWEGNEVIVFPRYKNRFADLLLGNPAYLVFLFFAGLVARYDLLHVHNGATEGFIASVVKRIRKKKFSYGYTFPFIQALEIKRKKSSLVRGIYYQSLIYFIKRSLTGADMVFPISNQMAIELSENLKISPASQFIISEAGSALFLDYRGEPVFAGDKIRLVYTGSLAKIRNPEFLIRVFELVAEKINGVELVILGWADKKNETDDFRDLINNSICSEQIRFPGRVPYAEVPSYIANCHIGLSPIIPKDIYLVSTPTKCIEYLSLGISVVANEEIPDQKYIISQSGGGVLARYDPDDFAEKIIYLIKQKDLRISCGRAGKQWIKENRSFDKLGISLNSQLKKLIS